MQLKKNQIQKNIYTVISNYTFNYNNEVFDCFSDNINITKIEDMVEKINNNEDISLNDIYLSIYGYQNYKNLVIQTNFLS